MYNIIYIHIILYILYDIYIYIPNYKIINIYIYIYNLLYTILYIYIISYIYISYHKYIYIYLFIVYIICIYVRCNIIYIHYIAYIYLYNIINCWLLAMIRSVRRFTCIEIMICPWQTVSLPTRYNSWSCLKVGYPQFRIVIILSFSH